MPVRLYLWNIMRAMSQKFVHWSAALILTHIKQIFDSVADS